MHMQGGRRLPDPVLPAGGARPAGASVLCGSGGRWSLRGNCSFSPSMERLANIDFLALVPRSAVLRPVRSLVRCVVALVPRVSLHFHPLDVDLPVRSRLDQSAAHRYHCCVPQLPRAVGRASHRARVLGVLRVVCSPNEAPSPQLQLPRAHFAATVALNTRSDRALLAARWLHGGPSSCARAAGE